MVERAPATGALPPALAAVLADRYRLERELGGGGMSRVFVATEPALARRVVIKVLPGEIVAGVSAERFAREIQLAASLQQANIVPVLAAGETGGAPWYAMPFVEGESLRARLARGPLDEAQATSVLRDVARALVHAHERGVVHRDIKPDNILLSGESAVVTDFGIAKAFAATRDAREAAGEGATITQVGTSLGTPAYMAPEQAAGDPGTDHRADLYALGCVAFELLAGRPPFDGRSIHELLVAHLTEPPPALGAARPGVSPGFAALVAQLLAKRPDERPANAREVLRRLDAVTGAGAHDSGALRVVPARSLGWALTRWATAAVSAYVLARAAVVGIGLPEWTVPLVTGLAGLGLPAVLGTWYVKRTAQRVAATTPMRTPGGTPTYGTMATLALKASPHVSWRRTRRLGIATAIGVAVLLAAVLVLRQFGLGPAASLLAAGRVKADSRLLVAEFASGGADSALGGVIAQAMRSSLGQSDAVRVVTQSEAAAALRRMTLPATTRLDDSTARAVAERDGIPLVVTGRVTTVGSGFLVSASIVATDSGTVLATLQRGARGADDLLEVVDKVARDVRARLGESLRSVARAPALADVTTGSLPALKAYTRALEVGDLGGDPYAAIPLLREAVRIDTGFAQAWRKIAAYSRTVGLRPAEQFDAAMTAYRLRDRLAGVERTEVEAYYYRLTDWRRAADIYRDAPGVSRNNYAVILLDGGRLTEALAVLQRQIREDSLAGRPPIRQLVLNRAYTMAATGDIVGARRQLAEFERTGQEYTAGRLRAWLAQVSGGVDSLPDAAARLRGSRLLPLRSLGTEIAAAIDGARGRLRAMAAMDAQLRARRDSVNPGSADAVRARLMTALVAGQLRRDGIGGVAVLDSLLRANPQAAVRAIDSPAPEFAVAYARLGKADRARALLDAWQRSAMPEERLARWADWHAAEGEIALAQGRPQLAVAQFRQVAVGDSGAQEPFWTLRGAFGLARAHDRAGAVDSARARYETIARAGETSFDTDFRVGVPTALRRLGELAEARGDTVEALRRYQAFLALWANADPELQPQVTEVRARAAALVRPQAVRR
jgi:tetratricopeptide (TPR) repeat protein